MRHTPKTKHELVVEFNVCIGVAGHGVAGTFLNNVGDITPEINSNKKANEGLRVRKILNCNLIHKLL